MPLAANLLFVAVSAACMAQAYGNSDDLPRIPIVNRTAEEIVLVETRAAPDNNVELEFFRNNAYNCGLSGQYTFMLINPTGGGGSGGGAAALGLHARRWLRVLG